MRLRLLGLLTSVLLLPTSIRVLDVIYAEAGAVAGPFVAVQPSATGAPVVPFRIRVPDNVLQDLQVRLGRSRFPDEIPGSGWEYGADLTYMKQLVSYWRDTFNWRTQEQRLNRFPQFKTNIDGLDLHFVHQRATTAAAVPLVLLHGYPDSFVTFTRVIDALADPASHGGQPEEAFHVVVPIAARLWFFGAPTPARLGSHSGRRRRHDPDGAPRLHAVRGARCRGWDV